MQTIVTRSGVTKVRLTQTERRYFDLVLKLCGKAGAVADAGNAMGEAATAGALALTAFLKALDAENKPKVLDGQKELFPVDGTEAPAVEAAQAAPVVPAAEAPAESAAAPAAKRGRPKKATPAEPAPNPPAVGTASTPMPGPIAKPEAAQADPVAAEEQAY